MMSRPRKVLERLYKRANKALTTPAVKNSDIRTRIDYVCRCLSNRAGVRLLMACMLAKIDRPLVDPRQPYTEIGGDHCFSGRTYDERHLGGFITAHNLPCNSTTAFLTPALRNMDRPLTTDVVIVGRPPQLYSDTLKVLDDVAAGRATAENVLTDAIRILVLVREEKAGRMATLLAGIHTSEGALPLPAEAIVTLITQHLACKNSSRLPVLIVAAAYQAVAKHIGEYALPLESHNAADLQTGARGDVEICLANDERVVTIYEMKMKRVTIGDIDQALSKVASRTPAIDNYVFITTDVIAKAVRDYALTVYEKTSGIEVVILDCLGFVRHFLHLFHRQRIDFLKSLTSDATPK